MEELTLLRLKEAGEKLTWIVNDGRSGSSSILLAELSMKESTKGSKTEKQSIANYLTQPSLLLYPPPLMIFQLGFF